MAIQTIGKKRINAPLAGISLQQANKGPASALNRDASVGPVNEDPVPPPAINPSTGLPTRKPEVQAGANPIVLPAIAGIVGAGGALAAGLAFPLVATIGIGAAAFGYFFGKKKYQKQ